ncbi:MAG: exodeoxyribonuclease VII small subunit [Acidobacteria bacterium]|nr:exodeoxyribonuclease VII small subunit [Acidobacteriota bacterium]
MADEPQQPIEYDASIPFEKRLAELDTLVKDLEAPNLSLERSLELFERGVKLSAECRKQLQDAETRIEMVVKRGRTTRVEPFR